MRKWRESIAFRVISIGVILLSIVFVLNYARKSPQRLSQIEQGFVGSWRQSEPATPYENWTFRDDGTLRFADSRGLTSKWRVIDGQLFVTHRYKMSLGRFTLPFKHSEMIQRPVEMSADGTTMQIGPAVGFPDSSVTLIRHQAQASDAK